MTLGEAIEAVAALASTGALIAALLALRNQRKELTLQRAELKLQREELAANREVMKEQQAQFERSAKAQEALADSQATLAKAQQEANQLALRAEHAQRSATVAQIRLTLISDTTQELRKLEVQQARAGQRSQGAASAVTHIRTLMRNEEKRIRDLDRMLSFESETNEGANE